MSDQPPTNLEFAEAQLAIEAAWVIARKGTTAKEELLAAEMIIQGIALLRKVDAEIVREEVAAGLRSGLGLRRSLASLTPKGSG